MKRFKKRPSPAMIVAMTALIISVGGTAFAGPIAEISLNRGEKKQIRKISRNIAGKVSNRRISRRAPGLSVATARNAVIASVANAAVNATNAKSADSADTVVDNAITTEKIQDAGVTTEDLEDAAVTLAKLAANSVDSSKVAPNSLTSADLAANSVGLSEIAANSVDSGEILANAVGASELESIIEVSENSASVANGSNAGATAECPLGTQAIAGGFDGQAGGFAWRVHRLIRVGNGFRAFGTNQTGGESFLQARAYCLDL